MGMSAVIPPEQVLRNNEMRLRALVAILQHRTENLQEFLDHSLDEVIGLTGSKIGYIYFYDEERKDFVLNSWSKDVMKECAVRDPQTCYELAKTGFWGEAVRQRKPLVLNQFHAPHPLKKGYPEGHVALRRFMSVPVFKQDRIVAVVGVANKDSDYDETDVLQLTLLMDGVWKSVEIRQAEQRLREATQHYLTVAKCIPDTIWSIDLSNRFTYVSPSIERTHGWTIEECSKLSLLDTVTPRQADKLELLLKTELTRATLQQYDRNSVVAFESEGLRKNGSTFWIEINASLVWSDDGSVVGVTGVTRDITERKRAEEGQDKLREQLAQAQKMESIGRLAGGVAHDMNNVLGAILGLATTQLERQPQAGPLSEALGTIAKACLRGRTMVQGLLDFSRPRLLRESLLDLNATVREEITLLERTTLQRTQFDTDLQGTLWPVMGDPGALSQTLMNLCVNAADAMPEGGRLRIRTRNSGTDRVELLVADSGCGMPREVLEKAVDPFFTTKPQGKGTGLGLSIVYATVKAHGGQMEIQSDPGEGTRVLITLPAHPAKMVELKPHDVPEVAQGCHMRVLVVDDDDLVQAALKDQLEFLGHSVAIASSGEEALQRLEQALEIDVVILDMNMPGLGGAQTLPLLRNLRPHVPVFLTTGRADQHVCDLAKQFSCVSVLPKPFGLRELRTQFNSINSKGQPGSPEPKY